MSVEDPHCYVFRFLNRLLQFPPISTLKPKYRGEQLVTIKVHLFRIEGGDARPTTQQIMEELISQRVSRWKAKQLKVPDRELAVQIAAMCWDYDSLPRMGPGCLLPDDNGGHVYIPYDESREGLPHDLQLRIEMLDNWFRQPANGPVLRQMDEFLEKEVNNTCLWEFLDGGNAARIDFHGKIKLLAKNRLTQEGVDVSPNDPLNPQFRFVMADITEFGKVKMKWYSLSWSCTESTVVRCLGASPRPLFSLETVLNRQLKELETIQHPDGAAKEAQDLANELKSRKRNMGEPEWFYFLSGAHESSVSLEDRTWVPLRKQPNDIKLMKRLCREEGKCAVVIRSWQLRHFKLCFRIHNLQRRQMHYCEAVEETAALEAGATGASGEPDHTEG